MLAAQSTLLSYLDVFWGAAIFAALIAVAQDDDLRVWKKLPEPVIAAPPPGMEVTGFRDPCLWREGDKWMLILGSGIRGKGGTILLYSSPDLRHWTYLHPLIEGDASGKSRAR